MRSKSRLTAIAPTARKVSRDGIIPLTFTA